MGDLALIVDPDAIERRYIAAVLAGEGFDVMQVETPVEGIVRAQRREEVAVIILAEETDPVHIADVIEVIRRVSEAPVLAIVTGVSGEIDSLDYGADESMTRPFSAFRLIAHARMLTRRMGDSSQDLGQSRDRPRKNSVMRMRPRPGRGRRSA